MQIFRQDVLVPGRTGDVLFPIRTIEDAEAAVKIAYLTAFAAAGIFALYLILAFVAGNTPYFSFFDVMLIVSFGLILASRPSRFAALGLSLCSFLMAMPLLIHNIYPLNVVDGAQILNALIFIYGSYKGIQGTFGYHHIMKTKDNVPQILKNGIIIFLYLLLITILFMAALAFPPTATALENLEEQTLASLWLMALFITIFAGSFGRLSGTRSFTGPEETPPVEHKIS